MSKIFFCLLFLSHANIMNDLKFIMEMPLIQHNALRITGRPQGITPTVKSNFTDGFFPQLRITHYEL